MTRRELLSAAMVANVPQSDRPRGQAKPTKVTRVEAILLQKAP